MLYSFVNSSGTIVGQPKEFDVPPSLPPTKGRWLPDVAPTYNEDIYTLERVEPVLPDAQAVAYKLVPVSVDEAKVVGKRLVNQNRTQRVVSGFTFNNKVIDSDHASAVNIIGAAVAAQIAHAQNLPFTVTWTCADNTTIDLDAVQMMDMMVQFAQHVNAQYVDARQRKDAITSANTSNVDEIIALVS